jgi:hypothetical protein
LTPGAFSKTNKKEEEAYTPFKNMYISAATDFNHPSILSRLTDLAKSLQ